MPVNMRSQKEESKSVTNETSTEITTAMVTSETDTAPLENRMDTTKVKLQTQLKMLQHLDRQTNKWLTSKNERKLQRHRANLRAKIEEAHALVTSSVKIKIEQGLEEDEITEWSEDQEETLKHYEESLGLVESKLIEIEHEKEAQKHDKIEAREEAKRVKLLQEEENRREIENQLEDRCLKRLRAEKQTAKLPKLEISKFKGTPLDWIRFWEQFKSEIDNAVVYSSAKSFIGFFIQISPSPIIGHWTFIGVFIWTSPSPIIGHWIFHSDQPFTDHRIFHWIFHSDQPFTDHQIFHCFIRTSPSLIIGFFTGPSLHEPLILDVGFFNSPLLVNRFNRFFIRTSSCHWSHRIFYQSFT